MSRYILIPVLVTVYFNMSKLLVFAFLLFFILLSFVFAVKLNSSKMAVNENNTPNPVSENHDPNPISDQNDNPNPISHQNDDSNPISLQNHDRLYRAPNVPMPRNKIKKFREEEREVMKNEILQEEEDGIISASVPPRREKVKLKMRSQGLSSAYQQFWLVKTSKTVIPSNEVKQQLKK